MRKRGPSLDLCNRFCRVRPMIALVLFAIVLNANAEPRYSFDIPAQMAPAALNMLAQQANVPLLFPYDQVVGIPTRALVGEYELQAAVLRLLDGTRLIGKLNERGVLVIEFLDGSVVKESQMDIQSDEGTLSMNNQQKQEQPRKPWLNRVVTVLAAAMIGSPAAAAEEGNEESGNTMEEIVVTATYRDTRLMDTPITISAVTDADIVNKGLEDVKDLFRAIPGMNFSMATTTYNKVTIRGLVPIDGGPATVGAYMDMVPVGASGQRGEHGFQLGSMFDIERVEVLKGPQGTLYGEGGMGGVVRYITKQPDPSEIDWSIRASTETMDHSSGLSHRIDGMLNLPLGDRAAVRLTLYSREKKGLIDALGLRNEKDVDWVEETGYRLKVLVQPTDNLTLTGMVDNTDLDVGGPGTAHHCFDIPFEVTGIPEVPFYPHPGIDCTGDISTGFSERPYTTDLTHPDHPSGGITNTDVYNFTAEWETGFATVTGSVSRFESDWAYDEEETPNGAFGKRFMELFNCFGIPVTTAAHPDGVCGSSGNQWWIDEGISDLYSSQGAWGARHNSNERDAYELRIVSNNDGPLQWTVGAYSKESTGLGGSHAKCPTKVPYRDLVEHCYLLWLFHPDIPVEEQGALANWGNTFLFGGRRSKVIDQEESIFGELSYRFNDQWEVSVGARTVDVTVDHTVFNIGANPTNAVQDHFVETNRETSPKFTVTWRPQDNLMFYGTWSHGFRPGIVNTGLVGTLADLEPLRGVDPRAEALYQTLFDKQVSKGDEAFNYEIGIKTTLANGGVSLTGALYHIDWENVIITTEAPEIEIQGLAPFGVDYADNAGAAISDGMEIELQGNITDALSWTFGANWMWKAEVGSPSVGNTAVVQGAMVQNVQTGNRLPATPETSGYGSLVYDFQVGGFDASARADLYWRSTQWRAANNERRTPGHESVDLRLQLTRDDYRLSFYVENATDEIIVYELTNNGYQYGRARSWGVELHYGL